MKFGVWDALSILALSLICVVLLACTAIFLNPGSALNPFPPPTLPAALVIPSVTNTPRLLPPTWTPAPLLVQETPTLRPSLTPLASNTVFVFASLTPTETLTPLPTETPTITSTYTASNFTATNTRPPREYDCAILSQTVLYNMQYPPNYDFDAAWVIRNVGTKTWDKNNFDYRWVGGDKLHKNKSAYDFIKDVTPGASYEFKIDMKAPPVAGTYSTSWGINLGGDTICAFSMQIVVK